MNKFFDKYESTFSVISSILLGVMAVIISCNSNKIAEYQTKVDYNEHTPEFHFKRRLEYEDSLNSYANEVFEIYKYGKAKNVNIELQPIIVIEYTINNINSKISFPIRGYFDMSFSGTMGDKILTMRGVKNNYNLYEIQQDIVKALKMTGCEFAFTQINYFSKINYLNFIGDRVNEYYEIDIGGEVTIDKSEYNDSVAPYVRDDSSELWLWMENGGESNYSEILDILKQKHFPEDES